MIYRLGAIAIIIILLFLFFAEKSGQRYPIAYVLISAIVGFMLLVGFIVKAE
jgi:RsiW-degrading membrane proteinase PrsW (M82 family)